jgi:hypothetical protein
MSVELSELRLVTFNRENESLFDGYLRTKHDVFIDELGWTTIPHIDGRALPDSFDEHGVFCAVVDRADEVIAVARGTLPLRMRDMYRGSLYSEIFGLGCVQALDGKIGTINSVAVRRQYRRNASPALGTQQRSGISDLLMRRTVEKLARIGAEAILLSVVRGPPYALMRRIGFKTINAAHFLHARDYSTDVNAPTLTVLDMAAVTRAFLGALRTHTLSLPAPGCAERDAIAELLAYLDMLDQRYANSK